jgi:hypothetical protein
MEYTIIVFIRIFCIFFRIYLLAFRQTGTGFSSTDGFSRTRRLLSKNEFFDSKLNEQVEVLFVFTTLKKLKIVIINAMRIHDMIE